MNRAGLFLLVLLVAQLGWLGYLSNQERSAGGARVTARLADTGPFHIDELRIEDARGNEVRLLHDREGWIVPDLGKLPADEARVSMLIKSLSADDPGWAVAHTLAARQRFRVADYHFRRRITLLAQGEVTATVFLGTSPSFRKVHARNADKSAIYSIKLNLFDLPALADGWLDPGLLRLKAPLRITADGYSLDRSSGEWRLGDGTRPDSRELSALLEGLQTLRISGVADAGLVDTVRQQEPALILQVESLSGTDTMALLKVDDRHVVHSTRWQQHFLISAYTYDLLTGIDAMLMSNLTVEN